MFISCPPLHTIRDGVEITTEQLETTSQVSASLTAASINKETLLQIPDQSDDLTNARVNKPVLNDEKILEIGYVVGQALTTTHITKQLTKTSILWIEGKQQDCSLEKSALKTLGVQIISSSNMEETLGKAQLNRYDLFISSVTQIADRQLDDILLDKLNELRGSSYFIAYKPIGHLDYANDLIKKGAFGVTNQPLELFQLVIGAVEEIQSASMKTSGKFERAVSRWAIHRFNATEIKYSVLREQAIPHLLSLRDEIREKNVAISTYYRNNSLINRIPNKIERQQHLLRNRNFDEVVIVLVTPVETMARRLATNIETFTDIPPKNSVVIGYLKDDNFEPIAFFPPHSSPIVWLEQEAIP